MRVRAYSTKIRVKLRSDLLGNAVRLISSLKSGVASFAERVEAGGVVSSRSFQIRRRRRFILPLPHATDARNVAAQSVAKTFVIARSKNTAAGVHEIVNGS